MEYNLCAAMKEVFRNLEILNFHGFGMITVGQPSSQEEKKKHLSSKVSFYKSVKLNRVKENTPQNKTFT